MSEQSACGIARAHVQAWDGHDWDRARSHLADDVHVTAATVDPFPPRVDTTGLEDYMHGLIEFGQAVVPGSTTVLHSTGDQHRAMLLVTSRVKFGPDAPEMSLPAARLYLIDDNQQIAEEQVIFFALPD